MRNTVYGRPQYPAEIEYVPRSHAEKLAVLAQANAYNAANRKRGQHRGPITTTMLIVLNVLLFKFLNNRNGDCFPSYTTIAAAAGCSEDTVGRTINALKEAKILDWDHCFVKRWDKTGKHWRVLRTSNAYVFNRPADIQNWSKPQNPRGTFKPINNLFLARIIHRLSTTISTRERRLE